MLRALHVNLQDAASFDSLVAKELIQRDNRNLNGLIGPIVGGMEQ